MQHNQLTEAALRRLVRRAGYDMRKRGGPICWDNHGEFMLVDVSQNVLIMGPHYDASLEDIAGYFSKH